MTIPCVLCGPCSLARAGVDGNSGGASCPSLSPVVVAYSIVVVTFSSSINREKWGSIFEHLLIIIREGAPHKQAKAIFPDGSCRVFQIAALLRVFL